ncbi:MAG: D-2-hydroxyacid dehydrogenase, partial [Acidobacteriota bacterium]
MDQITVVVLGDPAESALKKLDALGPGVTLKIAKTADGLGDALADARVLYSCIGNRQEIARIVERAPKLEWIQSRSAGLDSFLTPELIESPIPLTNGSGVFSQSLGEFVIAGALYFAKDMARMLRSKGERRWDVFDVYELSTQTMGIVGHGD